LQLVDDVAGGIRQHVTAVAEGYAGNRGGVASNLQASPRSSRENNKDM
jgi:hypothetical protein